MTKLTRKSLREYPPVEITIRPSNIHADCAGMHEQKYSLDNVRCHHENTLSKSPHAGLLAGPDGTRRAVHIAMFRCSINLDKRLYQLEDLMDRTVCSRPMGGTNSSVGSSETNAECALRSRSPLFMQQREGLLSRVRLPNKNMEHASPTACLLQNRPQGRQASQNTFVPADDLQIARSRDRESHGFRTDLYRHRLVHT
jgi:hypothetical protein